MKTNIFRHECSVLFFGTIVALVLVLYGGLSAQAQCNVEQTAKLLADDGAEDDRFGLAVAIDGTTAIVGASGDDDNGTNSGSVYVFDRTTGVKMFKLVPIDGAAGDRFGGAVSISGTSALIGALGDDDNGNWSGSAYLFDTTTGLQIVKLLPNDGAADDYFGRSVAISGSTAIIGASGDDDNGEDSGSAYLFDTTTGSQIAKLLPEDGAADDGFGFSVAISGNTAIVGARWDEDNGFHSGSAYLFDTTTGSQIVKLLPNDGESHDYFGRSVAISGSTAIVGAYGDSDNGLRSGSAYLFDTTTGSQIAKLLPDDGAAEDYFGESVAISGTTTIVGASNNDDNGPYSGSAYFFNTITGSQMAKCLPEDNAEGDQFGCSVAISGSAAIIGADGDEDSGSAYLFDVRCAEVVVCDSFQVVLGTLNSGGVSELSESDDQYLVLDPEFLTFRYQLEYTVDATSPSSAPNALEFSYESKAFNFVGTVEQKIELFNYDSGQFETVDSRLTTPADTVVSVDPGGDPTRFVQSGTSAMQARISYQNSLPFWVFSTQNLYLPYRVRGDHIFWTITP